MAASLSRQGFGGERGDIGLIVFGRLAVSPRGLLRGAILLYWCNCWLGADVGWVKDKMVSWVVGVGG